MTADLGHHSILHRHPHAAFINPDLLIAILPHHGSDPQCCAHVIGQIADMLRPRGGSDHAEPTDGGQDWKGDESHRND
jgi:hypothetical protein